VLFVIGAGIWMGLQHLNYRVSFSSVRRRLGLHEQEMIEQ